jgi:hypothetical protein
MALSNAERQARYRKRLKGAAGGPEIELLKRQIAELETGLNEARAKLGLAGIALSKSAAKPRP